MIQSLSAKTIWGFPGLFGSGGLFGGGSGGGLQPYLWAQRGGDIYPTGTTTPAAGQAFERMDTYDISPAETEITDDPAWERDTENDLTPLSI